MPRGLSGLVEKKTLSVLQALLQHPDTIFHLHSLAKAAHVPVSSTARIIPRLLQAGYAKEVRVGKWSLYTLNQGEEIEQIRGLL